jgi:hypothetical protein
MGPLGVWALKRSLRGLCNLLIIECMNKFEHNIQFVTKSLTSRSVLFRVFGGPETRGSKE